MLRFYGLAPIPESRVRGTISHLLESHQWTLMDPGWSIIKDLSIVSLICWENKTMRARMGQITFLPARKDVD